MADSEEFRIKRLMHEQEQSRVFDQVMGLGNFADSSQGSNTSSKSDGPQGTPAGGRVSGQEEQLEEDNSNSSGSRHEEKIGEAVEESLYPRIASVAKDQRSTFTMGPSGGGTGEAAFDDALDGLPSFGPEEDEEDEEEVDEDWRIAIPAESMQDGDYDKIKGKKSHSRKKRDKMQEQSSPLEPRGVEEEVEREATSGSANTSHSSKDNTPESSQDVGIVNQTRETEAQIESEHPPVVERNPVVSPNITIKDEPIDEGYEAALLPQSNPRQIKEELEHQEDELRISSVYSVGGGNTFVPPTAHQLTAVPPQQTTIFIQGRGAVLQAVAPLSVRPPAPIHTSLAAFTQLRPRPPVPPIPGSVRCSGCMKILLKGQTAFQRKGSTQLFCSTICLTGHLPPRVEGKGNQLCSLCNCEILRARDTITIPAEDNTYLHFCGQHCLSIFRHKAKKIEKAPEKLVDKQPEKKNEKPQEMPAEKPEDSAICSVCRTITRIEHEVSHHGRLHKLCSDACFVTWRKMRQLAMNCCDGCGLYCNSSSDSYHTLTFEKSELNFCGPTCITTYKQSCRRTVECAKCHKPAIVSVTIMERDEKGRVQLYCSPVCVQMSRPLQHTLSGSPFPCCLCKTVAIPQFHLAMVDGTIRNFCSYECVSTFRKTGHTGSDLVNGKSSPRDAPRLGPSSRASSVPPFPQDFPSSAPYSSHHGSNSSVPPLVPPPVSLTSTSAPGQDHPGTPAAQPMKMGEGGRGDPKVSCHQCTKFFFTKPLLFGHQDKIDLFCSMTCLDLYKTQNNILVMCEVCNKDKMPFDTMHYNGKDIFFCSKQCKQSFKISLTARNKDPPCRPCSYCFSISQKMLHSHYGGKLEEFCKPLCMSQYTVLYYGMGRCDSCRKQGYLNEKLQYMGSVRNFCNLTCLLGYCSLNFESRHHSNGTGAEPPHAPAQPQQSSKANPVIADVVSLANGSATQPSVPSDIALTGRLPNSSLDGKILDHASTQTDAMRGPPSYRRQMKNKSVLCRPFTVDQESSCQLLTPSTVSSDDSMSYGCEKAVKKLKTDQETAPSPPSANCSIQGDKVKVLMVPVPVPVFIPVPMNMYSQHTPVPMALPITLPVPIVIPPQCKEVRDAATQWDPWNDGTKDQSNAEVSLDQGDVPLVPVPVIAPPQRKDVAIQLDPLVLVTEVQNNTKAASQIKDVKDLAVQTEPMVAAKVPLPSSKDVVDTAVQTDSGFEKKDHLDNSKQLTPIVRLPICVPPLCKPPKAAAEVQPDALDRETADPVQYGVWKVEPERQMACEDSSTGHSKSTSEMENPTIAEAEESPNNAQTKILRPLTLARKKETNHYSRKRKRKAKSTPSEHQGTVTAEQHSPSLQMSNCEDGIPLGQDESQTSVVVKPKITQVEETSDAAQNKILPPITLARKKVASPSPCTRKLRTKPTSDPQDTSTGDQQSPSLPMGQDENTISKVVKTPINQDESPNAEQAKILPPKTLASKKMATRTSLKRKLKAQPTGDNKDGITADEEPPFSPMTNLEHEVPLAKDESATSEVETPTIPQVEESPNRSQTKIILPITLVKKKQGNRSSRKCKLKAKPTSDLKDTIAAPSLVTDLDNVLTLDQSKTKAPEVVMSTIQQVEENSNPAQTLIPASVILSRKKVTTIQKVEENPNPAQTQIPPPVILTRKKVPTIQQVEENPNPAQTQILPSVILSRKKVPVRSTRKRKVKAEPTTSEEQDSITVEQPVQTAQMTESGHDIPTASEVVTPAIVQVKDIPNTVQTKVPPPTTTKESTRSTRKSQAQKSTSEPSDTITPEQQPPSSPMADLENDFPMDRSDLKTSTPQRGVKRPREGFSGRKRGRRRTGPVDNSAALTTVNFELNYMYGVKAWKCWVQLHNAHSKRSNPVVVKEEILQCDSAELSYALSRFVKEVRRPNGEAYSPDSIFYLCLGIQQYLFSKGRIENIFTDELYSQFALEISAMLRLWKPKQLPNGSPMSSRVEESFLWECKQLGAYSPIVLLNTLLFFYTKNFHFTTVAQHQSLSFANFSLHTKHCSRAGKVIYLKYQQSIALPGRGETERVKKKQEKAVVDMEMEENVINPLHCPVRLYEFYLSRCPPTALKRTDMFYLQPERNVHTHSSYWYTSHTLHHTILQSMLTRILAVKEVQR
ncbi:zinc finger MYM-type protein 4-like isoform X2 [Stigmatopora argus]